MNIIMTRVSTDEQNKGNSPTDQLNACRAYAEQHGIAPIDLVAHDDYSGFAFDRPELDKVRALLRAHPGSTLIVRYGDRLGRGPAVIEAVCNDFAKSGVKLHLADRGLVDYTSPEGRMLLLFEAVGNGYVAEKNKQAMRNGKRAQIAAGIPVSAGKPPYGYVWDGRKRDTRLVIFEPHAVVVQNIYRWYHVEGLSPRQIAARLNGAGTPPPRTAQGYATGRRKDAGVWTADIVRNVLRNEVYAGTLPVYGARLDCPALIDRALWEQIQVNFTAGRSRFAIDRKKYDFLMARRLDCLCGHNIVGTTNGHTTYYLCNSARCHAGRCGLPYVRAQDVDRAVWSWIEEKYRDPATIEQAFYAQNAEAQQQNADVDRRILDVDDTIASLKRRLAGVMRELVDADDYSRAALKTIQTELVAGIREAEQRRAVYVRQRVPLVPDDHIHTVAQFGARLGKGLENAVTCAERREVVDALDLTGTLLVKNNTIVLRLHWPTPTEGEEVRVTVRQRS